MILGAVFVVASFGVVITRFGIFRYVYVHAFLYQTPVVVNSKSNVVQVVLCKPSLHFQDSLGSLADVART